MIQIENNHTIKKCDNCHQTQHKNYWQYITDGWIDRILCTDCIKKHILEEEI